jgi:hypothetical protein
MCPFSPSERAAMASGWDPYAFAEQMKRSTSPVSAFFLIDSLGAIAKCVQELARLTPYGMPCMKESTYFLRVREIYESGEEVINFDREVTLHWKSKDYLAYIRCHFFDKGRYEIELWLPGVIANDAREMFKDGREGFFCGFMPPAFYD